MDLLCCENQSNETRAYADPQLISDERVLRNLLKTEERNSLTTNAFPSVQREVNEHMRKIVAEWMLEVCEEQKCQDEVFLLAMNYMDRFLAVCAIRKNQLQLLGTACMLLASKLREPRPLSADVLVFYTDHSITMQELRNWELLVISKLKWDLSSVTAQDFLTHILRRLPIESLGISYEMARSHSKTLMVLCAREYTFTRYLPSMIASASIASALCGLGWLSKSGLSRAHLLNLLHEITAIEPDYLLHCLNQIDNMVRETYMNEYPNNVAISDTRTPRPEELTPPPSSSDKLLQHEPAGTPTDVHDIHF